jgi:hypothetical protein
MHYILLYVDLRFIILSTQAMFSDVALLYAEHIHQLT